MADCYECLMNSGPCDMSVLARKKGKFMKKIFLVTLAASFFLVGNQIASAADRAACMNSAQQLSEALKVLKGLGLSPYTNQVARDCGLDLGECENNEPGLAYSSYKAQCILQKAAEKLAK